MSVKYVPTDASFSIVSLNALYTFSKAAFDKVVVLEGPFQTLQDNRKNVFDTVDKLCARCNGYLTGTKASAGMKKKVQNALYKLRGERIDKSVAPPPPVITPENAATVDLQNHQISVSQTGFDNKLENFMTFFELLKNIPEYIPTDDEIKVITLAALYVEMEKVNGFVVDDTPNMVNARNDRNKYLYTLKTGVVDVAFLVKNYLKSFKGGIKSPEYKQSSKLSFKYPRIKPKS